MNCPLEVCQWGWKWEGHHTTFLLSHWLGGSPWEERVLITTIMFIHWLRVTLRIACPWLVWVMVLEGVPEWRFRRMPRTELSANVAENWTNTGETEQISKYLLMIWSQISHYANTEKWILELSLWCKVKIGGSRVNLQFSR